MKFNEDGTLDISMIKYLKNVIDEFPEIIRGRAATPARNQAVDISKDIPESRLLPQPRNQHIFAQLHYQVFWAPQPQEIARHGPQSSHRSQKLCLCFSETLSGIFSRSFISSRIPDVWRQAPFSRKASDVCQTTTDQSPWLQCHRTYCNYVNSNPVTMA